MHYYGKMLCTHWDALGLLGALSGATCSCGPHSLASVPPSLQPGTLTHSPATVPVPVSPTTPGLHEHDATANNVEELHFIGLHSYNKIW